MHRRVRRSSSATRRVLPGWVRDSSGPQKPVKSTLSFPKERLPSPHLHTGQLGLLTLDGTAVESSPPMTWRSKGHCARGSCYSRRGALPETLTISSRPAYSLDGAIVVTGGRGSLQRGVAPTGEVGTCFFGRLSYRTSERAGMSDSPLSAQSSPLSAQRLDGMAGARVQSRGSTIAVSRGARLRLPVLPPPDERT